MAKNKFADGSCRDSIYVSGKEVCADENGRYGGGMPSTYDDYVAQLYDQSSLGANARVYLN
jgi:hypothetical protein